MKPPLLAAFALFILIHSVPVSAANATAQSLSQNLQITSFSVNPDPAYAGSTVEFLLGVESTGNTVATFSSSVVVQDSSGRQLAKVDYLDLAIPGGETQSLSKGFDTSGMAAGNYSAVASINGSDGSSSKLISNFELLPSPQAASPPQPEQPQQPAANPACSDQAVCGPPGDCIDNYTTSICTVGGCQEKGYFLVQDCAPAPQFQLEKQACDAIPALCSTSPQGDWAIYFCSPIIIALLIFAAAMLRKFERGY